jgi:hypothetical protein
MSTPSFSMEIFYRPPPRLSYEYLGLLMGLSPGSIRLRFESFSRVFSTVRGVGIAGGER